MTSWESCDLIRIFKSTAPLHCRGTYYATDCIGVVSSGVIAWDTILILLVDISFVDTVLHVNGIRLGLKGCWEIRIA